MTDLKTLRQTLRDLAPRATPGQWVTERCDADNGYIHFSVNDSEMRQVAFCHEDIHPKTYRADAMLIALSNPENILALLTALETAEAALVFYGNEENYHDAGFSHDGCENSVDKDEGKLALKALSKLRGGR